jgi:hypothetical protein
MKTAPVYRAMLALAVFLCADCGDGPVAGGHDSVENPSVSVSLLDSAGKPYGAASVSVYARYQNPFKDSLPLLSIAGSGDSAVKVTDTALQSAFTRAKTRGTPSPSADTLEFNLLASAPGGEAFSGGYALIHTLTGWTFIRRTGSDIAYGNAKGILAGSARMQAPILGQRGQIGSKGLELGLKRVFVPGSPYAALLSADGSFTLDRIAVGRYELKAVAADDKVYTAADSLTAGSDYSASDWAEAEVIWVSP